VHSIEIEPWLQLWSQSKTQDYIPYWRETTDEISRVKRTVGLGADVELRTILHLRKIVEAFTPQDLYGYEDWVSAMKLLIDLLKKNNGSAEQIELLEAQAKYHFLETFGQVDHARFEELSSGIHPEDPLQPFEKFAPLVRALADLANIDFESVHRGEWEITDFAKS
jgi:hypothetical protein